MLINGIGYESLKWRNNMDESIFSKKTHEGLDTVTNKIKSNFSPSKYNRDQKLYEYLELSLDETINQYRSIHNESLTIQNKKKSQSAIAEERDFDIFDLLENSTYAKIIKYSYNLHHFQVCMHLLSIDWDDWVNKNRNHGDQGKHRFFLINAKDKKNTTYEAQVFNRALDPDNRLIAITVPGKAGKIQFAPILHEMGHYIGGRSRVSRVDQLAELTWLFFLNRVHHVCMCRYDGIDDGNPSYQYTSTNDTPLNWARARYNSIITGYLKIIHCIVQSQWKINKEHMAGHDLYATKTLSKCIAFLKKNIFAKKNSYFWNKFLQWVNQENGIEIVEVEIPPIKRTKPIYTLEPLSETILAEVKTACNYIIRSFERESYQVIQQIANYIEEPTADCFMINICGMNPSQYLNLILQQAWERWSIDSRTDNVTKGFCDYLFSGIIRTRVLSVLFALDEVNKMNIESQKHALYVGITKKQRALHNGRVKILDWYNEHKEEIQTRIKATEAEDEKSNILPVAFEQDYLDYQDLITYYILQIHRDHDHYITLRQHPDEIIDIIRMFKEESQLLLRIRLWLFYHCEKDNKWLEKYEIRKKETSEKESMHNIQQNDAVIGESVSC